MKKITVVDIQRMKQEKKKIVTMTAYDFQMARIIDKAGVDILLIGDSGGRYVLGHEDNNSVTMDEMVLMARCVSRGAKQALVVADMPFMSYQISREDALLNAGRLIQEAGAQAVKLEVGPAYAPTVEAVVKAGIPVMAHMGQTPMTTIGSDYRSGSADEVQVMRDAEALESAGAFSLLLTGISPELTERITEKAKIPTIAGSAPATAATARSASLTASWGLPWKSSSGHAPRTVRWRCLGSRRPSALPPTYGPASRRALAKIRPSKQANSAEEKWQSS